MTTAIKERPMIFSAPMIRPLMDGRKIQTRRLIKPQPTLLRKGGQVAFESDRYLWKGEERTWEYIVSRCPYGCRRGDQIWVKEGHWLPEACTSQACLYEDGKSLVVTAGGSRMYGDDPIKPYVDRGLVTTKAEEENRGRKRSPIFMPRWASRITLEITEVRVQRIQEISEEDVKAEGIDYDSDLFNAYEPHWDLKLVDAFRRLWDSINGKKPGCSWKDNPFVRAISFRRVK